MLEPSQIREMSREAAVRAATNGHKPLCVWQEDIEAIRAGRSPARAIPFLGDYIPYGYKALVDGDGKQKTAFVDSSGFGTDRELAMTQARFANILNPGDYIAIVEAGEFQVVVGFYEMTRRPA